MQFNDYLPPRWTTVTEFRILTSKEKVFWQTDSNDPWTIARPLTNKERKAHAHLAIAQELWMEWPNDVTLEITIKGERYQLSRLSNNIRISKHAIINKWRVIRTLYNSHADEQMKFFVTELDALQLLLMKKLLKKQVQRNDAKKYKILKTVAQVDLYAKINIDNGQ